MFTDITVLPVVWAMAVVLVATLFAGLVLGSVISISAVSLALRWVRRSDSADGVMTEDDEEGVRELFGKMAGVPPEVLNDQRVRRRRAREEAGDEDDGPYPAVDGGSLL